MPQFLNHNFKFTAKCNAAQFQCADIQQMSHICTILTVPQFQTRTSASSTQPMENPRLKLYTPNFRIQPHVEHTIMSKSLLQQIFFAQSSQHSLIQHFTSFPCSLHTLKKQYNLLRQLLYVVYLKDIHMDFNFCLQQSVATEYFRRFEIKICIPEFLSSFFWSPELQYTDHQMYTVQKFAADTIVYPDILWQLSFPNYLKPCQCSLAFENLNTELIPVNNQTESQVNVAWSSMNPKLSLELEYGNSQTITNFQLPKSMQLGLQQL